MTRFDDCLKYVLQSEGGFVNDPRDPGGATNKGITQAVYDAYRTLRAQPRRSVAHILDDEVAGIYRRQYWNAVHGDELPAGLDYVAFDYAVNSGPGRACRGLQAAVGATEDGKIGMLTLARVAAADHVLTINRMCDARLAFLNTLETWDHFGRGWLSRVNTVRSRALAMAQSAKVAA
jgi:lysozyme family protein